MRISWFGHPNCQSYGPRHAKIATRASQNAPRDQHGHQNGAKGAPKGAPSALKGPQGLPKSAQEPPKGRPKSEKITLGGHLGPPRKMKSCKKLQIWMKRCQNGLFGRILTAFSSIFSIFHNLFALPWMEVTGTFS